MYFHGRAVFACSYGHMFAIDMMQYASNPNQVIQCISCHKSMNFIGVVDDTDGDAAAHFWRELLYEYEDIETSFDEATGVCTHKCRPSTWKIHYNPDKWFNFETGKELILKSNGIFLEKKG